MEPHSHTHIQFRTDTSLRTSSLISSFQSASSILPPPSGPSSGSSKSSPHSCATVNSKRPFRGRPRSSRLLSSAEGPLRRLFFLNGPLTHNCCGATMTTTTTRLNRHGLANRYHPSLPPPRIFLSGGPGHAQASRGCFVIHGTFLTRSRDYQANSALSVNGRVGARCNPFGARLKITFTVGRTRCKLLGCNFTEHFVTLGQPPRT